MVLLNVLEHIEHDRIAVERVRRIMKPGGLAVIEVLAGPQLYDIYDKHLQHCRRYRLADLARLLTGYGFRIEDQSHLGFFVDPGLPPSSGATVSGWTRRPTSSPAS